jgi:hypothetical protein
MHRVTTVCRTPTLPQPLPPAHLPFHRRMPVMNSFQPVVQHADALVQCKVPQQALALTDSPATADPDPHARNRFVR